MKSQMSLDNYGRIKDSNGNMSRTENSKDQITANRRSLLLCLGVLTGHHSITSMNSRRDRNKPDYNRLFAEAEEIDRRLHNLHYCIT